MSDGARPIEATVAAVVDNRGMLCAQGILRLMRAMLTVPPAGVVKVLSTDPAAEHDYPAQWRNTGHSFLGHRWESTPRWGTLILSLIQKRAETGAMKTLAVIASRGSFNSLLQVVTVLMAAVGSDVAVRAFFRDEAVLKVTRARAGEIDLSEVYRGQEGAVRERLSAQGLSDLPRLLREARGAGDAGSPPSSWRTGR